MREAPTAQYATIAAEVWRGYRPFLIVFCIDFLISASMWLVLYLFKLLTDVLKVDGWAAKVILDVHSAGAVAAFSIFATLLVLDVIRIHRHHRAAQDDNGTD